MKFYFAKTYDDVRKIIFADEAKKTSKISSKVVKNKVTKIKNEKQN